VERTTASDCFLHQHGSTARPTWLSVFDRQKLGPVANWLKVRPTARYADFVDHLVQRLKASLPAMGKVRIAQLLARAGSVLAVSTVGRMVKRQPATGALSYFSASSTA
jgi:hypothetical protein